MNTKKFVTSAASVITAGALIIGGTFAYFTDSAESTGNTLGAGRLAIELRDFDGALINGPIFDSSEAAEPLYPGGPSAFACATVSNEGSLDFNWTIKGVKTSEGDFDLADALWGRTRTWIGAAEGPESPADCDDDTNWTTGDVALPISAILPIGEVKQGLLGVDEETHFRWEYFLPTGVSNDFNGASTTLTFEAKAYQINDPAYDLAYPPTP